MTQSDISHGFTWFDPQSVDFVEVPPPVLPPDSDGAWDEAVRRNHDLLDGPIVLSTEFCFDCDSARVAWARGTYRYRSVCGTPGATEVSAVFVGVIQPVTDGRVVVGTTSSWTSHPGRLQLPGGSMEPPLDGATLTLDDLGAHASVELYEETGLDVSHESLVPFCAGQMPNGNVGFFFVAEPREQGEIRERFTARCVADQAEGGEPEFRNLEFLSPTGDVPSDAASHVAPVLQRYATTRFS